MNCRDTLYNRVEKPCIIGEISTYSCFGECVSGKANGFTRDGGEGITIAWNTSGKVKSVTGGSSPLDFFYSALGQRQMKAYQADGGKAFDYYIHDATGNIMAIYTLRDNYNLFQLKEQHIYGSGRLGIYNRNIEVYPSEEVIPLSFTRGVKRYELSNHLGNVNAVISDRKIQFKGGYMADIKSYVDYYPFGYQIPERAWSSTDYRFGFNGQEKDDEIYGEGKTLAFEARVYNAVLGRWFSIDPLQINYSHKSPYIFVGDNPIYYRDIGGRYKLPPEEAAKSSLFTQYLTHYMSTDVQNSSRIITGLQTYGQLTPEQIKEALTPGKGPTIRIVSSESIQHAGGEYRSHTNEILINQRLIDQLNGASEEDRQAALLHIISTLLHETVHYGDFQTGGYEKDNMDALYKGYVKDDFGKIISIYKSIFGDEKGHVFEADVYFYEGNTNELWTREIETIEDAKDAIREKLKTEEGYKDLPTIPNQ